MRNSPNSPVPPMSHGWAKLPGLTELVHARFASQRFQPHAHDTWSLCAVISGTKNIALPSAAPVLARAGDIYLLRPEQAHAGCSVDAETCEYAMLHISAEEWRTQSGLRGMTEAHQGVPPTHNPPLARTVAAFVLGRLAQHTLVPDWSALCTALFAQYPATACPAPEPAGKLPHRIAREYLRNNWDRAVALEELSRLSALSGFELTRRFSATYGLPPHRYQLSVRINQAKNYLRRGVPIAEVAIATGFSDQSHFGRVFKSMLGITPGALARHTEG